MTHRSLAAFVIACLIPVTIAAQANRRTIYREVGEVIEIGPNQHRTQTEIVIDAPPAEVWAVLTDFENMPKWSSSFQGLTGDFRNGGKVVARFRAGGDGNVREFPHVLTLKEGVSFQWSDPFAAAPTIRDNHTYMVEPFGDGQTRFTQVDEFTGAPSGQLTTLAAANATRESYITFNRELRNEVNRRRSQR